MSKTERINSPASVHSVFLMMTTTLLQTGELLETGNPLTAVETPAKGHVQSSPIHTYSPPDGTQLPWKELVWDQGFLLNSKMQECKKAKLIMCSRQYPNRSTRNATGQDCI